MSVTISVDEIDWGPPCWREFIARNLKQLPPLQDCVIVDCGGGRGNLVSYLTLSGAVAINVDIDLAKLRLGKYNLGVCAQAENLPLRAESVDVVTIVSALQYMEHTRVLEECLRVLKPGGLLLLHENGARNPFILLVRMFRAAVGVVNPRWRNYNATIKRYFRPNIVTCDCRWCVKRFESALLFGAVIPIVDHASQGRELGTRYLGFLKTVDKAIIRVAPGLEGLAWLHCLALAKRCDDH